MDDLTGRNLLRQRAQTEVNVRRSESLRDKTRPNAEAKRMPSPAPVVDSPIRRHSSSNTVEATPTRRFSSGNRELTPAMYVMDR